MSMDLDAAFDRLERRLVVALASLVVFYVLWRLIFGSLIGPFGPQILWAGAFSVAAYALYARLSLGLIGPRVSPWLFFLPRRRRKVLIDALNRPLRNRLVAAIVTVLVCVAILVGPVVFLLYQFGRIGVDFTMDSLARAYGTRDLSDLLALLSDPQKVRLLIEDMRSDIVAHVPPIVGQHLTADRVREWTVGMTEDVAGWAFSFSGRLVQSIAVFLFSAVMTLALTVWFLRDGPQLVARIKGMSPLPKEQTDTVAASMLHAVQATFVGGLVAAAVQGTIGTIGLLLAGVPSWPLFGGLMFVVSLVPFLGGWIVWVPWAVVLLLSGNVVGAVILSVFGVLQGLSDNIIKPVVFKGRLGTVNEFVVFFCFLGAVRTWGVNGLIFGPMAAAIVAFFMDAVSRRIGSQDAAEQES